MNTNQEFLEKIMALVKQDAKDKRESAGRNGSFHDGGASELECQVRFFHYGLSGVLPQEWEKYKDQTDPEYQEYLRLKKKFGNK